MKVSVPINAQGDRLAVPGEPGAVEALVRKREHEAAAIAQDRILGHLEGVPGLMDALSDQQRDHLVAVVRDLAHRTAIDYHRKLLDIYREARRYVPTFDCVPDYRDEQTAAEVVRRIQGAPGSILQPAAPTTISTPASRASASTCSAPGA